MSRVAVIGAGYVGLTTAACLADLGNRVVVVDIDESKVEQLRRHRIHFYEPGLQEVVARNAQAGRLSFSTSYGDAVPGAEFAFIAVATPEGEGGEADLRFVDAAARSIAETMDGYLVIVNKSTVPIGTGDVVSERIREVGTAHSFDVVSNPEFLREGSALRDFMQPDRVVIGGHNREAAMRVAGLYAPLEAPILIYDIYTAEMVKYASNSFLAARISFINEISRICERVGADAKLVAEGMGLDHRIGPAFLDAGIGYGGSCLIGSETVLVRRDGDVTLTSLERLYSELEYGEEAEVLTWRPDAATPEFMPIAAATRRVIDGHVLEVRTNMGRRVTCTEDHPWVTGTGIKLAAELTADDWLPLAQLAPPADPRRLQNRVTVARSHDVEDSDALNSIEMYEDDANASGVLLKTATNRASPPSQLRTDAAFWRVVGLYIAEGHVAYRQRLPDAIWTETPEHKRALLSGMWQGDGSWSLISGGPSVVLEYGTASAELADGLLRLLGDLGIAASMRIGRTAKSTCDNYWIRISGADQVERMAGLVAETHTPRLLASIARQTKRIAPTGYRRGPAHTAWVRVVDVVRKPFTGAVYSLEVPGAHTFVTTGGLVTHNCFPKDVKALSAIATRFELHPALLKAVMDINHDQRMLVVDKLVECLDGGLSGATIGLLGLSFKPNTDDMREAPSIDIARALIERGALVRAYDPAAIDRAKPLLPEVEYMGDPYEVAGGADGIVIVTEWNEFRQLDLHRLRETMRRPVVVDGRNIYDPARMRELGFVYRGIGRN